MTINHMIISISLTEHKHIIFIINIYLKTYKRNNDLKLKFILFFNFNFF